MPNLIAGRTVVIELLQKEVNSDNIARHLLPLLKDSTQRKIMLQDFEEIRRSLGIPGAYERAAESILKRTQHG
jgi:lipid-A-disaccharide synthase